MEFNPISYLVRLTGSVFNLIAGLASIIGLCIIFLKDKEQLIIALVAFILFLLLCLLRLIWFTDQFLKSKTESGYYKLATIVKYSTNDGKHYIQELQKYIQCKKMIMDRHEHEFYWTGSESPIIESKTMKFETIKSSDNHYKTHLSLLVHLALYNSNKNV